MTVPLHGQLTVSGTTTALSATPVACIAWTLKAPLSNAKPVFVGSSAVTSSTGFQMDPGDEVTYELLSQNGQPTYNLRPSDLFVVGTSPDTVSWLASP